MLEGLELRAKATLPKLEGSRTGRVFQHLSPQDSFEKSFDEIPATINWRCQGYSVQFLILVDKVKSQLTRN